MVDDMVDIGERHGLHGEQLGDLPSGDDDDDDDVICVGHTA